MHHVKHIRKGGVKSSGFTALMSQLNRKQIPVCHSCHVKIHNGTYAGTSLKELRMSQKKTSSSDPNEPSLITRLRNDYLNSEIWRAVCSESCTYGSVGG